MYGSRGRGLWKLGALGLVLLVSAGCARDGEGEALPDQGPPTEPSPPAPGVIVNVYDCVDGERVVVEGLGREAVRLHRVGERITLGRVDNDAEYAYAGDDLHWSVSGSDAVLTLPDQQRVRCGETPKAAVWEEARLRGVNYRAEALDRSWELELRDRTLAFRHRERSEPVRVEDVRWTGEEPLEVSGNGTDLRLEPVGGECGEPDSGLETVRLIVDDRLLEGCGRFLDNDHQRG